MLSVKEGILDAEKRISTILLNMNFNNLKSVCVNSKGVSFIQVLLASSAIAGLALVGLKLSEDQRALAKTTYENYLGAYLFDEMKGLLQEPGVCKATLEGLNPLGDAFSVFRRPLNNGKGDNLVALHFPLSKKEGEGYFDSKIKIDSYEITGAPSQNNKLINFKAVFTLNESKRKLIKEVPLTYRLNEKNEISDCRLAVSRKEVTTDGFWFKKGEILVLENLKLKIGELESSGAQVLVSGPVKLIEEEDKDCTIEKEGSLENHRGKLVYCHNYKWKPFGYREPKWKEVITYKVSQNQKGQTQENTKAHRLCYLSGQEKKMRSDGCEIKRLEERAYSSYQIIAFTSAAATKNICEVSCVD